MAIDPFVLAKQQAAIGKRPAHRPLGSKDKKRRPTRLCSFPDCRRKHHGAGLCKAHWCQKWRGMDLHRLDDRKPRARKDFIARVVARLAAKGIHVEAAA